MGGGGGGATYFPSEPNKLHGLDTQTRRARTATIRGGRK